MEDRYAAMQALEMADVPRADYMDGQPHINAEMRASVVGWMMEAAESFELLPEVLALAVRLFDMTLSKWTSTRTQLQLIGIVALSLATKFHEDVRTFFVEDWKEIADDVYSRKKIAGAEHKMAAMLDYNMTTPTAFDFAQEIAAMAGATEAPEAALQQIELSMLSYDALEFVPSLVAAASLHMADVGLDVERHSGYSASDLAPCIAVLEALPPSELVSRRHCKNV
ncbi:G2/mitotic-specific cyclin [Medusavirus stheno T3]|uniref:G2/mitotic-specific cyclin n=1 Tax=Medusavirus stheno T3 TaxID=3069717 RepID=A0A7S7YEL7_9VIRU|nr:G2/mitotic-specific cyclin [Acanthamoeba castellanii medusavirus]QPB44386.1 G2/mitotic-specific cyclin [Medusavirus stheno T3]